MTVSDSKDFRRLSGERVVARCELFNRAFNSMLLEESKSPFHIVFNMRGGCIYIQQYLDARHLHALFPYRRLGKISQLRIFNEFSEKFDLHDIKVRFVRLKPGDDAIGIIFRFVDLNPEQLDQLQQARDALPALALSEDALQFEDDLSPWKNQYSEYQLREAI